MTQKMKWLVATGVFVGLLLVLALTAWILIPSDEDLRRYAESTLQQRLGVEVSVGRLHWHALPRPSVVIEDAATRQPHPVKVERIVAYPQWRALLQRRLVMDLVEVDGAVLPQLSLGQLGVARKEPPVETDEVPVERIEFRRVTWINRYGLALDYEGEADFDPHWLPRRAALRRSGVQTPLSLLLERQGDTSRWDALVTAGGGSAAGHVDLQMPPNAAMRLTGDLLPRNIEVQSALASLKRKSAVAGKASGSTALTGEGKTLIDLVRSLHTATQFSLAPATLVRFDLHKAIKTLGKDHAGQTEFVSAEGRMDTQNTPEGMVVHFSGVKAASGDLTVSGEATLAKRQIDATANVDLVNGVVGIPLRIHGPVTKPEVSMQGGAIAGAAIGTAVLPGIGTAIGARIGAAIGGVFKKEPAKRP